MNVKHLTQVSGTFIGFLFGVAAGVLATAAIIGRAHGPTCRAPVLDFGDVTIYTFTPKNPNDLRAEELAMKKNGRLFLYGIRNQNGRMTDLVITDGHDNIRFGVVASTGSGDWANAVYGGTRYGGLESERYLDIDFDGIFDVKAVSSTADGAVPSKYIYWHGQWKQVNQFDEEGLTAGSAGETYVFNKGYGWSVR